MLITTPTYCEAVQYASTINIFLLSMNHCFGLGKPSVHSTSSVLLFVLLRTAVTEKINKSFGKNKTTVNKPEHSH